MKGVCLLSEISRIPTDVEAIGLSSTLAFECTGTTVPVPVKRHRGEPGHTRSRDTRDTRAHAGKRITRTTDSTAARTAASPESTAPRKPVQVPVLYCTGTGTVPVLHMLSHADAACRRAWHAGCRRADADDMASLLSKVSRNPKPARWSTNNITGQSAFTDEWLPFGASTRETLLALQSFKEAPAKQSINSWLGAIISIDITRTRYRAAAEAIASCGFVPQHVPAAVPSQYANLDAMIAELFGVSPRSLIHMSAYEVGLLLSHKRALKLIAQGPYAWGAVFEEDAYLHEAISPRQASELLHNAFSAVANEKIVVYLGACRPECRSPNKAQDARVDGMPLKLLRGGSCRGFCTHAYALGRRHAATFFAQVFDCQEDAQRCGLECETRPCYLDWAYRRHFSRAHGAWLLCGGLVSRFSHEHRGLFVQNRSGLGRNIGTTLSHTYQPWKEAEDRAARQRCDGLVGRTSGVSSPFAKHALSPSASPLLLSTLRNASALPLRKVFMTLRWTGRVGNLLFGMATLLGFVARLNQSLVPTEAFAFNLPSVAAVPAEQLLENFPLLATKVLVHKNAMRPPVKSEEIKLKGQGWYDLRHQLELAHESGFLFPQAQLSDVRRCKPCTYRVIEDRAGTFDGMKIRRLANWIRSPPTGCTLGMVELVGYFQSFKYFDAFGDSVIRPALVIPRPPPSPPSEQRVTSEDIPASQGEADAILARARNGSVSAHKVVGVQVRLGDKLDGGAAYAPTSWKYYLMAMLHLKRTLATGKRRISFVVTAGGTLGDNRADILEARKHLSPASIGGRVFFSPSKDPHVDLAVLRGCDALVIGPSTLGWWAAYLARLPNGRTIAPVHIINPALSTTHELRKGFILRDYYPPHWLLLDNSGNGTIVPASQNEAFRNPWAHGWGFG